MLEDIKFYKDFYISAKEGSYAKAAKEHYKSQSTLSRNVAALEEKLNKKLVVTNNKGFELTSDGEELYRKLDTVFNLDLFNTESKKLEGKLIIGATRNIADYKLIEYLSKYNNLYPNVTIKIVTDSASNLNEYLIKHNIDVLIDYLPHINSSDKYSFEVKAIAQFKTCFACSKKFYEENGKNIKSLSDLKKYNLVIPGSSRRRQILDETLQVNNVELNPKIEMPDSKLMIDFVNNHNYIGYFIEEEIVNTDLVKLDLKENLPINSIGIIYPKKTLSEIGKKFIELVVGES